MKRNLLKTLLASVLLLCGVGANAQELLDKFYFGVTGYDDSGNPATVSATVYEDWSFVVKLADADKTVGASKADVYAYMQSVPTLGVTTKREHKVTIETGVTVTPQKLSVWLPNIYGFKGTHVPVTVIDGSLKQNFVYCISAVNSNNEIVATPCDVAETRAAWKIITDNVTDDSNDGDSYLKAKEGAFIKIGNEKLTFNKDVDMLKGVWTVSEIFSNMDSDLEYKKVVNDKKAVLYLPAGTELAIGGKVATLDKPATITLDCANVAEDELTDKISTALDNMGTSDAVAIQELLGLIDSFIGLINKADVVPCEVLFDPTLNEDPAPVGDVVLDIYAGSAQPMTGKSIADFLTIQATNKNAVALADEKYASQLLGKGYTNIVIAYAAGKAGKYYECEKLVLLDPSQTGKPYDQANYYFPYDFVALSGSYDCSATRRNNFVCVPFALNAESVGAGQLLTFAYYEPIFEDGEQKVNPDGTKAAYAYFNVNTEIPAGQPCLIYDPDKAGIHADLTNKLIAGGEPNNTTNLKGTYAASTDFAGYPFYTVSSSTGKETLGNAPATLNPFRACLELAYDTEFDGANNHGTSNAKQIDIAIIGANGEATTIEGVSLGYVNAKKGIYTINGVKVSDMSKPGLYIVDGVKKFVK